MSGTAKTRLTKIEISDGKKKHLYLVSAKTAKAVATLLDNCEDAPTDDAIDARELYPELKNPVKRAAAAFHGTRLRLGLTQKEMAEKIGLSQSDISKIEKGEREISRKLALRIGKVFNIDYKRFL